VSVHFARLSHIRAQINIAAPPASVICASTSSTGQRCCRGSAAEKRVERRQDCGIACCGSNCPRPPTCSRLLGVIRDRVEPAAGPAMSAVPRRRKQNGV